jgi:transcriptional regulator with XRE-family HTH domain
MANEGGALRAARERMGWSQSRAASELAALAVRRGHDVASPASLKTQLSRWENQHVLPEDTYRILLSELYGRTNAELGLAEERSAAEVDEAEQLRSDLAVAGGLDPTDIDLLEAQLAATNALDRRRGSAAVADSLDAQLSHLERVFAHAIVPAVRRRLAGLVGSAAILAGRVQADRARPASAWRHLERAKQAGQDAGDPYLSCWALVEQAAVLLEIGRYPAAVEVLEVAHERRPGDIGPWFRAWLSARLGTAHAAGGAADLARSAYSAAERELGAAPPRIDIGRPAGVHIEFDQAAFRRERGHGLHILRDDVDALVDLRSALADGGSAREVASLHVDLAHAFGATGDTSAAGAHAHTARDLTARIGSARLAARLDAVGRAVESQVSRS